MTDPMTPLTAESERKRLAAALARYLSEGPGTFRHLLDYLDLDYATAQREGWLDFNNALVGREDKIEAAAARRAIEGSRVVEAMRDWTPRRNLAELDAIRARLTRIEELLSKRDARHFEASPHERCGYPGCPQTPTPHDSWSGHIPTECHRPQPDCHPFTPEAR